MSIRYSKSDGSAYRVQAFVSGQKTVEDIFYNNAMVFFSLKEEI